MPRTAMWGAIALIALVIGLAVGQDRTDAADPPPTVTVAVAGDIACDPGSSSFNGGNGTATSCRQRYTSDLLLDPGLDRVLALGDDQYSNGALSKFNKSYKPSWGRVKSITRPVPGNHEYQSGTAKGYFDYFNGVGVANGPAGNRSKGYYSFDLGAWHLIALNSECARVGGCAEGSPQNDWLEADLAAHPSDCTLAYFHNPRFSSGSEHGNDPTMGPFWDDLYAAGAEIVLAGHDHAYERFAPQSPDGVADPDGIREFVVGTGGKSLLPFGTVRANSVVRHSDTFGVLELTLAPGDYAWEFVPEAGKTFTDVGTGTCSTADPPPPPPPSEVLSLGFDEGSGTVAADDSGNGNDADLLNGAGWGPGEAGSALALDGANDVAAVDTSASLGGFTNALTVAGWVHRSAVQSGWHDVAARQLGTGAADQFYLAFKDGTPYFGVNTTTGGAQKVGTGSAPLDEWVHLAGVYNGSTIALYVNGARRASVAKSGTIVSSARPLLIGAGANGPDPLATNENLAGRIDELRLYNRALSASEIAALAAGP